MSVKWHVTHLIGTLMKSNTAHPSEGLTNMAHSPILHSSDHLSILSPTAGNTGEVISVTPTTETFLHVVFMQMEVA